MKISEILVLTLVAVSFILAWYFYPTLPDQLASHWNIHGEVDGYTSKAWALFTIPFTLIALTIVTSLIPRIDPLKSK